MSFRRLDAKGKPIPRDGRSMRRPAEKLIRGVPHFHYEISGAIPQADGKRLQYRKRFWLPDDRAADAKEREMLRKPPAEALTWVEAHRRWVEGNRHRFSPGHIANTEITIRQWCQAFGANSTIEGTSLAAFAGWVEDKAKEGKGRGAQIKRGHLLAMARWCRARGMVEAIPFEHAPKPEARTAKRKPAGVEQFHRIAAILPPHMVSMWRIMGLTGMRISAACTLRESDITAQELTVTTKGNKRISYGMTPALAAVIEEARAFKRGGVLKGRGKDRKLVPVDNVFLFVNSRGVAWNKGTYNNQLHHCLDAAGMEKITPHQLRHLAGTVMAQSNLSPDIIQAGLGHESRKSAESYIDQTQSMRDQALAVVADFLQIKGGFCANSTNSKQGGGDGDDLEKPRVICPCCGGKGFIYQ